MSDFKYKLERSPAKKGKCPQCGASGKLRYYEGFHGDERYGRCDRESQCGFHRWPESDDTPIHIPAPRRKKQLFPSEPAEYRFESVFHEYLRGFGFKDEDFRNEGVISDSQGRTIFLFRNQEGRLVNCKTIQYEIRDGQLRRNKAFTPVSMVPAPEGRENGEYYAMCLGGEHLLDTSKERIVCIVESEKSRIIARKFYPQFDWVDCQSADGLSDGSNDTSDKISPLFGRQVYWVCDADGGQKITTDDGKERIRRGGRYNSSIRNLSSYQIAWKMVDLFPHRNDGWDICDEILYGGRPEIIPTGDNTAKSAPESTIDNKPVEIPNRDAYVRSELIAERIEEARIDITRNLGDNLVRIAESLTSFGNRGLDLLHRIARMALDYELSPSLVDDVFAKASAAKRKGKAGKALMDIAADFGIDVSKPARSEEKRSSDLDLVPPNNHSEYQMYGFYEHEGSYFTIRSNTHAEVSNFVMKILYHVQTDDHNAYRLIEIKNRYGMVAVIQLNTDDFTSVGTFRKAIEKRGNFLFKGSDVDLFRLKDKLQRDEVPTTMVESLGYSKSESCWFWSNGLYDTSGQDSTDKFKPVDENGIVAWNGHNYFIPAGAKFFEKKENLYANDRKFIYIKSDITFEQWAAQYKMVYGDKGMVGMTFYVACLFRDIIYKAMDRRFPILNLYGKRGSGKGAYAQSLLRLFGHEQDQFMLGGAGTVKGFMRKFAQYRNSIVWLDEYKNNLNKFFIESLKNIYDGVGYERAKNDNSFQTDTTPIHSGCILSGQEMPTIEPALFTRVILLTFPEAHRTDAERAAFQRLTDMEALGLSHISNEFLAHRSVFESSYREVLNTTLNELIKEVNNPEIDERLYRNVACLLSVVRIISDHKCVDLPFSYVEMKSFCISNLKEQYYIQAGSDDVSKFWQVVEYLFNANMISENKEFTLQEGYIYIRVQHVHPLYYKELIAKKDPNVLPKETLESYLKSDSNRYVNTVKKSFGGQYTWCMQFRYNMLGIDLIRENDDNVRDQRYREMNVTTATADISKQNQDMPF